MKKFNLAKVISLVFVCVMLLGALSLSVFATEDEKVEIVAQNMYYGDTYQIMYAINAPEGATVKATDSKGNEINVVPFAERPTDTVKGVECKIYILEKGVAAQAIDEVITVTVEYGNKKAVKNYSVLQYIYERSQKVEGAELEMLQALLAYAVKADIFLDKVTTSFDTYQYVSVEGATVNGANPTGMYAAGATPFANIDAIEYDATGYELVITVNGEAKSLDELKALVVADATINVVVSVNEKAHEHSYTPEVTDPTCTADGYTTYTCECGDSYTEPGETATGHKDENGDFKCDACSVKVLPEDGEVLTLAQANAIGKLFEHNTYSEQKYYVVGFITEVYNTTYGNMYITDGTDKFTVYGVYMNGVRYDAMTTKPQVNDEITVYAAIGNYNGNAQMKNAEIDDFIVHECEYYYTEQVTKPTCTAKGYTTYTCDVCGDSYTGNETEALGHSYVDGVCSVCGVADTHVHNYTPKVTDPTCTADGYTTFTCEECGDSYTEPGETATGHSDADGDIKCDICQALALPEDGATITIAQAIIIGKAQAHDTYTTNKYYVTGTITEVYNNQYGNMHITDGTNTFTVYGIYKDGVRYDAMETKPQPFDEITVYGTIGQYNDAPQMKNAELDDLVVHVCEYSDATCQVKATCAVCGKTTGEFADHAMVDGVCSVCGYEEGGALVEKTYEYTFTKTTFNANGTKDLGGVNWTLDGNGGYWGIDSQNGKGQQFGSGNKPYKSMTLTSDSFNNVTKIVINTSGASSINGSFTVTVGGQQIGVTTKLTTKATEYTFEIPAGATGPIVFTYTQTSSKAIYIKSIEVTYAE